MPKAFPFGKNPAFQIAKDKAAAEFVATRRVLAAGGHRSAIGSFPSDKAATSAASTANAPRKK